MIVSLSVWPCDEQATHPGCNPAFGLTVGLGSNKPLQTLIAGGSGYRRRMDGCLATERKLLLLLAPVQLLHFSSPTVRFQACGGVFSVKGKIKIPRPELTSSPPNPTLCTSCLAHSMTTVVIKFLPSFQKLSYGV